MAESPVRSVECGKGGAARIESRAVFVGHVENGDPHPFEVWVNGAEQPRGLGAVAKTLSMDMRAQDKAWLRMKLDMLARTAGDDAFDCPMPPISPNMCASSSIT